MKSEAFTDRDRAERISTQIFGLSLTAVFVGMLLLNAISYWMRSLVIRAPTRVLIRQGRMEPQARAPQLVNDAGKAADEA
jgi:hypothetical protein